METVEVVLPLGAIIGLMAVFVFVVWRLSEAVSLWAKNGGRIRLPKWKPMRVPSEQERMADAKREYEGRLRMIDGMPLDEDERHCAKQEAKDKLLQRLKELL